MTPRLYRAAAACLAVSSLATLAYSQSSNSTLGPQVGVFFPSDSTLQNVIGKSWVSFGLGQVSVDQYQPGKLTPNYLFFEGGSNGSKVFMLAYSYGMVYPLLGGGGPHIMTKASTITPYFAIRGGLSYIDYAVQADVNNRLSGKAIGYNANAELGILFSNRLSLSARYDLFSSHDGLQFNGLSLSLTYGLVQF